VLRQLYQYVAFNSTITAAIKHHQYITTNTKISYRDTLIQRQCSLLYATRCKAEVEVTVYKLQDAIKVKGKGKGEGKGKVLDIAPQVTNLRGARVHGTHSSAAHTCLIPSQL